MGGPSSCYNIADLAAAARRRLPRGVWEYLERGVEDETGMARNRAGFDRLALVPRIGRNVERIDTAAIVFGQRSALPFAIAPTGAAGMMWHHGDLALASAAAKADIPFTISSASTMELEHIAAIGGRLWFQLYCWADRDLSLAVIDRAAAAGCEALMVTLDLPKQPNREYLIRNGYGLPMQVNRRNLSDLLTHPRWLTGVIFRALLGGGLPTQANLPADMRHSVMRGGRPGAHFKQDNLSWDDLARLRERWPGKFMLKGILHPDDAARALSIGAYGVIVSNHGARSLDHSVASISALPAIVEAVGGKLAVMLDSGVRRGSDVVKALALGADMVLVGRAPLYGLSAFGEPGAARAISLLAEEIVRTMAMLGLTDIAQIDRAALA